MEEMGKERGRGRAIWKGRERRRESQVGGEEERWGRGQRGEGKRARDRLNNIIQGM